MDSSRIRQPLNGFLSLAPTTSGSYPQKPQPKPQQQEPQQPEQKQPEQSAAAAADEVPQANNTAASRSSSVSTVSSASGLRFLKLGPVHYGEHPDADKDDWSAVTE